MQELDDLVLLREYVERDSEEAFATLVERHVNKVYSIALRQTRNPHQAEEITQAVFVILAKKSRSLPKTVVLSGWLCRTAHLAAMTFLRSEIRRSRRERKARMQTLPNEPESDLWFQIAPLLDTAMAGLSETDHHAIVLRYFDGKSMKEIGAALGASEDTAKKRVNRAVEKLRLYLTKRGVIVPAAVLTAAISANSVQAAPAVLAKTATAIAVAKGAAASTSTMAVIKGALKLMAWTKAKTAVIAIAAVIVATGTTTVVVRKIATPTIDEVWWKPDYANLKKVPPLAAVRQSKPGMGEEAVMSDRGIKMIGQSLSPKFLFASAYYFVNERTVLPRELADERFDLILTLTNRQQEALQQELKKKLGYVGTVKPIETDVLLLKIKNAESLKLRISADTNETKFSPTAVRIVMKHQSIAQLAANIEGRFETPVLDRTGLTERYDIPMPNLWRKNSKGGFGVSNDIAKSELQQTLDEIGLELVPAHETIEMLVVERANSNQASSTR